MIIPQHMQALELTQTIDRYPDLHSNLKLVEKPVPVPRPGEVLIRVAATPIHPSDLMILKGLYGVRKAVPFVPGAEASGIVVAAGTGLLGRFYMGRKVCFVTNDSGTWAEYAVAPAFQVLPLTNNIRLTEGAMHFVNPMTALALMDMVRAENHRAIIQTAAASALGKMIVQLAAQANIPLINIVRRREQAEILQALGAQYSVANIVDSSLPDFAEKLTQLARQLNATIAFDAVSGDLTEPLLNAMPHNGKIVVYGALSEAALTADPRHFIFEGKSITGFWLAHWVQNRHLLQHLQTAIRVRRLMPAQLKSHVAACVSLDQVTDAILRYVDRMSDGKVLITPHKDIEC